MGILIGLAILPTVFSFAAYSADFPRHKNPAMIQEEVFFPIQLISLYGEVVRLQVEGKWDLASSELKKVLLSYIPETLRYIFTRFNELIGDVADKLKEVKEGIDSAQDFLRQGEIEKAREVLDNVWITLLEAERDLSELNASVDELRGKIGASPAERLREKIAPLGKMADEYKKRIQELYGEAQEGKRLESTFLQISVSEIKIFVGDSFKVYGRLRGENGESLDERRIDIFLEKEKVSEAITDQEGEFETKIYFPYLYEKTATVFASFTPQGEDKDRFYPSTSNQVLLEPIFYTPQIRVEHEKPVYPVLPFKLEGQLFLMDKPLTYYPVKVKLAPKIVKLQTDDKGKFQTELSLPPDAGKTFRLSVSVPSEGIIGPANLDLDIPVTYKVPSMVIELPLVVVPPFIPLEIKGKVDIADEDMKDALVRVVTESADVETLVKEKVFKIKLDIPFFRFSGWEKVNIFLRPQEPWVSSLHKEAQVLVINPLTLLPFIGVLGLFLRTSSRRKKTKQAQELVEKKEIRAPGPKFFEKRKLTGIPKIYSAAVAFVVHLTGIKQVPAHTISEYLNLVKDRLEKKAKDFELISLTTEKFLYAPVEIMVEEKKEAIAALGRLRK